MEESLSCGSSPDHKLVASESPALRLIVAKYAPPIASIASRHFIEWMTGMQWKLECLYSPFEQFWGELVKGQMQCRLESHLFDITVTHLHSHVSNTVASV